MEKRALVFLTALVSGISIFLNKFAVGGFDPDVFTFSKNLVVGVFLLSILLLLKTPLNLTRPQWSKLALIGLIGGSIPFVLFFRGLQLTSAANAAMIHKSMFLIVAVLAASFLKEKVNSRILTALLLLLAGNFIMINPNFSFGVGELMVLGATLLWSIEIIISKHILKDLSGNTVAFGRMFFGSLFILGYLAIAGKTPMIFQQTFSQYMWIFFTSALLLLYVTTWYNGLKHITVSLATSVLALGTVVTTLLNFAYGLPMSQNALMGIIFLVSGIAVYVSDYAVGKSAWKA